MEPVLLVKLMMKIKKKKTKEEKRKRKKKNKHTFQVIRCLRVRGFLMALNYQNRKRTCYSSSQKPAFKSNQR